MTLRDLKGRFIKGEQSWNKGTKFTKEHRKNLSESLQGRKLSDNHKKRIGKSNQGPRPHRRVSKFIDDKGYVWIWINNKRIREHHYIWLRDNTWGMWFVPENWHVHHKNQNTSDNRIENLACIPNNIHGELHHKIKMEVI